MSRHARPAVRRLVAVGMCAAAGTVMPLAATSPAATAVTPVTRYVAVDLGSLGGGFARATDLNESGVVVGWSWLADDVTVRAFRWTEPTGMVALGSLGGDAQAAAVDESGRIVGWSETADGEQHAVLWRAGGSIVDLGTLPGDEWSEALAITDDGTVLGVSAGADGIGRRSFVWDEALGARALSLPDGLVASDLNDAGWIVGNPGFVDDPVGGFRELDTLGGSSAVAQAVNAAGAVAGSADLYPGDEASQAVLWDAAGVPTGLGTLPGVGPYTDGCCTGALDLNATGIVVGWGTVDGDDVSRAFVWDAAAGIRDLGTLGGEEATAYAVNDAGLVVGEAMVGDGTWRTNATMWRPSDDSTPPTLTCVPTNFLLGERRTRVEPTVTDDGSGPLAPVVSRWVSTDRVGARTVSLTGSDRAGNAATVTCRFTVRYRSAGGFFRGPVDPRPVVNVAEAGRVVPVRWRITDVDGVPIDTLAGATVTVRAVSLQPGLATDRIEWYAAAAKGLRPLGDGTYQYDWHVPAALRGTTVVLRIDLGEGYLHKAYVRVV